MNIVVDNLYVNYSLTGKGKLVLLMHGWGDNLNGLAGLASNLSKNYKVLSIDLPGFGSSEPPKESWDLDDYAAIIKDILTKLELQPLYAVIGHSNGGAVSIRAISLGLISPDKLILLAASGIRNRQKAKRFMLKIVAKTGKALTFFLPVRYKQSLQKRLYGTIGSDLLVEPKLKETFRRTVRQDVSIDASKIDCPTLLIYAKNDRAVPLSYGVEYNSLIKNSKLEVIQDAGHFVHLDQPDIVLSKISEFLR